MIKWCSHCDTTTHSDPECWSTRGLNTHDPFWFLYDPINDKETLDVDASLWAQAQAVAVTTDGLINRESIRDAVRFLASKASEVFAADRAARRRIWDAQRQQDNPLVRKNTLHAELHRQMKEYVCRMFPYSNISITDCDRSLSYEDQLKGSYAIGFDGSNAEENRLLLATVEFLVNMWKKAHHESA